MASWRRLAAVALALAVALLAACGQRESTSPPAAEEQAKTLVVVGGTTAVSMDIHKVSDSPSFSVLGHIYETLFEITPDGQIRPLLAESYESPDGMVHTIKLRQGVTFTDGTPFNAEAVKVNLERVKSSGQWAHLLGPLQSIETPDEYTVVLRTSQPFAPLYVHLTHGGLAMISPAAIAQGDEYLATHAVGTGPFKLKSYQKDVQVVLERNEQYWGTKPKLAEVTFKAVKEAGPRILEVESGSADVALHVPATEVARLQSNPDLTVVRNDTVRVLYIYFNTQRKPFDDKRVRQALNYAVDKQAIVDNLLGGAGRVLDAPMAPAVFGYSAQTPYPYDPDKARALLREAGVAPNTPVTLYHPTGRYPQDAQIAEAVAAQLREVGLDVRLQTMEWAQYLEFIRKPAGENQVEMAMIGWSTPTLDADYALYSLLHSSQWPPAFNLSFYRNEQVDRLLDQGRTNTDPEARKQAYAEAIRIIWDDAPWLFLHSVTEFTAVRKDVQGLVLYPTERVVVTGVDRP